MVYVGTRKYKYGRMFLSHMASPDTLELHKMAEEIGINRKHFQNKEGRPHYDICQQKKSIAMLKGVQEVNDKDLIRLCFK